MTQEFYSTRCVASKPIENIMTSGRVTTRSKYCEPGFKGFVSFMASVVIDKWLQLGLT